MREFRAPDGIRWSVEVTNPGASNAIVLFRHPGGPLEHKDRYAWFLAHGPEARNVTARLAPDSVLKLLDERALQRLFRSSVPVSEERAIYRAV